MGLCSKSSKLFLTVLAIVTVIVIIRTLTLVPLNKGEKECKPLDSDFIKADRELLKRFQGALQFQTISRSASEISTTELRNIQTYIRKSRNNFIRFL